MLFFFKSYGAHRDLHSFPTRRSSDLGSDPEKVARALLGRGPQVAQLSLPVRGSGFIACRSPPVAHVASWSSTRVEVDRKSTRLNSSHANISYAVFCLKKKKQVKYIER